MASVAVIVAIVTFGVFLLAIISLKGSANASREPSKKLQAAGQGESIEVDLPPSLDDQHGDVEDEPLYKPLPGKSHMRLLLLHAGKSSLLLASLKEVDLAEDPEFEALSYAWGNPRFIDKHIDVDGHKIAIRDNLWTALQRIRLPSESRALWVDALCICQTDTEEKAQQVSLIGNIFKQAVRVLVWVGEHDRRSDDLFEPWTQQINPPAEALNPGWPFPAIAGGVEKQRADLNLELKKSKKQRFWNQLKRGRSSSQTDMVSDGSMKDDPTSLEDESTLERRRVWSAFLSREYWTRRWIVQEIALAREITVHCGESTMDWDKLIEERYTRARSSEQKDVLGRLEGITFFTTTSESPNLFFRLVEFRRQRVRAAPLLELMETFQDSKCTDDRDRVYAFLALDSEQPIIQPSYKIDMQTLFLEVLSSRISRSPPPVEMIETQQSNSVAKIKLMCRVFGLGSKQRKEIDKCIWERLALPLRATSDYSNMSNYLIRYYHCAIYEMDPDDPELFIYYGLTY